MVALTGLDSDGMRHAIHRFFQLDAHATTVRREVIGGATTFVTLSYIIFVQPAVLGATGMDAGAVMTATCLSSAFATLLMGVWANYPIAVAPAMGHNFYFAFMVAGPVAAGGLGYSWQVALGANCIAGIAFLVLSLVGLRERLVDAIPDSLKHAIAAGIGLLIALVASSGRACYGRHRGHWSRSAISAIRRR